MTADETRTAVAAEKARDNTPDDEYVAMLARAAEAQS